MQKLVRLPKAFKENPTRAVWDYMLWGCGTATRIRMLHTAQCSTTITMIQLLRNILFPSQMWLVRFSTR